MHNEADKNTNDNSEVTTGEIASPKSHWQHLHHFKTWYGSHKKWSIPATILLALLVLLIIPWTRYQILGLFIKKDYTVQVNDSTAHIPVSGALVTAGSISAKTNGNGQATLHSLKVGPHDFHVTKKYYLDNTINLTAPALKQKTIPIVSITATGRQVKVTITNVINKKTIANVDISVAGTTAKTDSSGNALIVLPANSTSQKAKLSLNGYNDSNVTIQVSNTEIKQNNFQLTPAGKVYFLSKLSGKIDVVKTNLDGSDRQTVQAGTGKEEDANTVLLASKDWNYLALLSARDGPQKLFVINTNDDKLLNMDEGNATFQPVGWVGHYFVYTVSRNGYNPWQPNSFSIKSYNADTGQLLTLVNSNAQGTNNNDAEYENILYTQIFANNVVYTRTWYQYPGYLSVDGKQNTIASIRADGTGNNTIKSVDSASQYISNVFIAKPNELDFGVYSTDYSQPGTYFSVDKNGKVTPNSNLTDSDVNAEPVTYLQSPSGNQTFWSEERDGKNSLFVGDQDGAGTKQIAQLSEYDVYGWYTDNYLLVSKDSDELYVIPVSGIKSDSEAIKVSDYHKPAQSFYGYGGGYGGL